MKYKIIDYNCETKDIPLYDGYITVLSLKNLKNISSSFLQKVIPTKDKIILIDLNDRVITILKMCKVYEFLNIKKNIDEVFSDIKKNHR